MRHSWAVVILAACSRDIVFDFGSETITTPTNPPSLSDPVIEDVFRQRIPEQVDILWVVDNSASMLAEQEKLGANFESFLLYYRNSGLDWHIGVVSTDMRETTEAGRLQGAAGFLWTDPTVPDPVGTFSQMALLGRDGSAKEQGRAAAHAALTEPLRSGYNRGFYREDALLSIIVVSDEKDFSDSPGVPGFVDWMLALKPDPTWVDFSAITAIDTECAGAISQDYITIAEATGGAAYSICERDWTEILEQIGIRAAGLQREFFMTQVPDVETLTVSIEDEGAVFEFEQDVDYFYDGDHNSINFIRYTPRATAYVHIKYTLKL